MEFWWAEVERRVLFRWGEMPQFVREVVRFRRGMRSIVEN